MTNRADTEMRVRSIVSKLVWQMPDLARDALEAEHKAVRELMALFDGGADKCLLCGQEPWRHEHRYVCKESE